MINRDFVLSLILPAVNDTLACRQQLVYDQFPKSQFENQIVISSLFVTYMIKYSV